MLGNVSFIGSALAFAEGGVGAGAAAAAGS